MKPTCFKVRLTPPLALFLALLLAFCLALASGAALAQAPALGDAPALQAPGNLPQATVWRAPSGLYSVREGVLETGTLVRAYETTDGQVFAVSWRGPVQPDLSTLLGTYFSTFKKAADEARRVSQVGRRGSPVQMAQDGLVVNASGRMPHFFGYAYVTALVPFGLNIKEIVQ